MSTHDLVQSYYNSLNRKDDKWQELYDTDAVFSDASKTVNAKGKAAVIQSFIPFLQGIESVKVKQMIVEGAEACAIAGYLYVNSKGQKMSQDVAEAWKIRNGKLAELTIYFDLLAYRNFMRA
jgi:ketosteroid isomerase-like protein